MVEGSDDDSDEDIESREDDDHVKLSISAWRNLP